MIDIGSIETIIGVVFGFTLNEVATQWREKRTQRRQIRSIRALLHLEIDQNLALLGDFWTKVSEVGESEQDREQDPEKLRGRLARRLLSIPFPRWTHQMWESQVGLLPIALSETEIKQVHYLQGQLDRITSICTTLSALASEEHEDLRAVGTAPRQRGAFIFIASRNFHREAPALYRELEQIVEDVLGKGNPLPN